MNGRTILWLGGFLCVALSTGCEEETERPAPAEFPGDREPTNPGSGQPTPIGGSSDAGVDEDGSTPIDPNLRAGCIVLDGAGTENQLTVDTIDVDPVRVLFDRGFAGYDPASCGAQPKFLAALTFGECIPRSGAHFLVSMPADAIGVNVTPGSIPVGFNQFVTIRYYDPATATYGNCEGATGFLFFEDLSGEARAPIRGNFSMTLPDCSNPDRAPVELNGNFELAVGESLDTVCPTQP